jgi:hypothetical protein
MPDGVNGESERIGGIHFEVSAVGAENAAQQVNKAAAAVKVAGGEAAAASPKMAAAAASVRSVGDAGNSAATGGGLRGVANYLKEITGGATSLIGTVTSIIGKITLVGAGVSFVLDMVKLLKGESDKVKEKWADIQATFASAMDAINAYKNTDPSASFSIIEKRAEEARDAAWKEVEARGYITEAYKTYAEKIKQIDRGVAEARKRLQTEVYTDNLSKIEQSLDAQEKLRDADFQSWLASVGEYWDKADKVAQDAQELEQKRMRQYYAAKMDLTRQYTAELKSQAAIIQGMIDAQTKFANQFNSKLNIEQLQSINATITRIENAINARQRF